jgi:4-amino-4-deoxy-L-arabinose transferase-like glycosyltransferase
MTSETSQTRSVDHRAVLAGLVILGFALRLVAAVVVQGFVTARGKLCVFPDTDVYWHLAGRMRNGLSFEVSQWEVPHLAIRTPGYPLFLAVCQAIFGAASLMPVRVVQAGLGASCVGLIYVLVRRIRPEGSTALIAAGLAAIEPYTIGISALVLSEALFVPLMLVSLWGTAALWECSVWSTRRWLLALATGAAHGAAILVRPSWALAVPLLLAACVVVVGQGHRAKAFRKAMIITLGVVVIMTPWWIRNARVYGRFVPTALWVGASLYDGLNPRADGSSDMRFLEAPDIRMLDETAQDIELRSRAVNFALSHPGRALRLSLIKVGRFWSPWPNADTLRAPGVAIASALVTLPLFALIAVGTIRCRRDARALILLLGPLLYFCALHAVFVSSIRYRIPPEVSALGLAAVGLRRSANDR